MDRTSSSPHDRRRHTSFACLRNAIGPLLCFRMVLMLCNLSQHISVSDKSASQVRMSDLTSRGCTGQGISSGRWPTTAGKTSISTAHQATASCRSYWRYPMATIGSPRALRLGHSPHSVSETGHFPVESSPMSSCLVKVAASDQISAPLAARLGGGAMLILAWQALTTRQSHHCCPRTHN